MAYFDFNATTPLHPAVRDFLASRLREEVSTPANPSSVHQQGRSARKRLEDARQTVAQIMGCEPQEVCFTATGSEADALALIGSWRARKNTTRRKIVLSAIEHSAVLLAAKQLEAEGAEIIHLAPNADGRISEDTLEKHLTEDVFLCSLMWANNETGVLQPARAAALMCLKQGILFHTDAVQAVGKVPVNLREVNADLLAITAHKFGGPTGIGALIVRRGVELASLVPGHQEKGRRGGTSNVLYAEAMALALQLTSEALPETSQRIQRLRDAFEAELAHRIQGVHFHGQGAPRVPNTSNVRFDGSDAEALLIALDLAGFSVSTGAACASGSLSPSHVLTAMGLSGKQAHESLRISLGPSTTEQEVEQLIALLVEEVPKAREAAQLGG